MYSMRPTWQAPRDVGPLVAQLPVCRHQLMLLSLSPGILADVRVQVVVPALWWRQKQDKERGGLVRVGVNTG
jgi:hypothetical protein